MTRYVALLRGINIGGNSSIAMADLREVFIGFGYEDVTTYLRTGNIVFGAPSGDQDRLVTEIRKGISDGLGKDVGVLLRTAAELDAVLTSNPFLGEQDDLTKLLVTFLAADPGADKAGALASPPGETGSLALVGREVYVHVPDGYGRTKLSNAFVEKKLGVAATTRNWRSVLRLREMATA
ncbi:DUF1697 domain-containing protein [Sphaerisporangium sp. NBC_01403]|uniref:DUF1697 domain-containing protein n=1 Tax=Sphaerisporangium sp. NBC_01403 TaxID=2903599 RepID=UPI0032446CF3